MRITLNLSDPFDLEATLCCGQAFRWERQGEWWHGVVGERVIKIRQAGQSLEIQNTDDSFARNYFGLHDDLTSILSQISKDEHVRQAVDMFQGLRILRQDPWECLISYICATYKNIAAIKQMLYNLSRRFGRKVSLDSQDFYAFPKPGKLAEASEVELAECGLGYRVRYVQETARIVYYGLFDLENLRKKSYEQARAELLNLPGVGPKAADCILLFSLEKLQSFPIDVWIRRAILKHYADHFSGELVARISEKESLTNSEYKELSLFGRRYFGEFAGYAQEYLYHYERTIN
jgi:N-glycosylase/DNA lyase